MDFTIYQDPYLQGFLPVLYLYLYNISGGTIAPPDTDTGLTIIDKRNVDQYMTPAGSRARPRRRSTSRGRPAPSATRRPPPAPDAPRPTTGEPSP